jgi:hypothetical protein
VHLEKAMILVTGDVVLDHNIYAGQRFTPDSDALSGMRRRKQPGGALLPYGLLDALERTTSSAGEKPDGPSAVQVAFGLQEATADALQDWPAGFQAGAIWEPFDGPAGGQLHWRLSKNLGYGARENSGYPASPAQGLDGLKPKVLVIDDGGLGFRLKTASRCWPLFLRSAGEAPVPEWIVLKMSRPLARGDLWRELTSRWCDRLIVLVSGDSLRREDVLMSRGLSWESTVDDLMEEIQTNPAIRGLQSCRHLTIALRGDAALWIDGPGKKEQGPCRLVFDRERGEGEWEDGQKDCSAFGFLSAVAAALAWHLKGTGSARPLDFAPALKAGLSTTRFLREYGHGPVKGGEPGFPFQEAASHILNPAHKYATAELRRSRPGRLEARGAAGAGNWTILGQAGHSDAFPGPLFGPARRLALIGPAALQNVPCARFGKLLTLDRREIEALRSLRQLMLSYRIGGPQKQPLSLAVFGAPGSGKSFGLKQIAEGVFGDKNPVLEFNLSQFQGPGDLIGAYHQVRDNVLAGWTPVVFWDEFDSRDYFWLQYLLAPMQDGVFQEGQATHTIGKCVFVFAGGTSRDFAHFGPPAEPHSGEGAAQQKARRDFAMAKGPDFKSRLAGFLDVLGPNPMQRYDEIAAQEGLDPWKDDSADLGYPVRRAILLRSLLGLVKEKANEPLAIDRGLLTALLEIGHYRNGARSLEKLVSQMKDRGGLPLRRAHLPPDSLLGLYVDDVPRFHELTRRSYAFLAQAEKLAPMPHRDWRNALPKEEKGGHYDVPFDKLDQEGKDSNIAAAMRIPEILALAGFVLESGQASEGEKQAVSQFLGEHLEILAEAEHDGWADQRRVEGWTYAPPPRDDVKRTHPLLVPYAELDEEQKEKDRRTIQNYPKYARKAGFRIVSERGGGSGS